MEKRKLDMQSFKPRPGIFLHKGCKIIVSIDDGRWHLSISREKRLPSYEDIKEARYLFMPPDIFVGQIFPPQQYFINLHKYCLHLWQVEETHHFYG